mgnify:CR=1 FL=1
MKRLFLSCCVLLAGTTFTATAQSPTGRYARFLTAPEGYVCLRTADSICINGIANEAVWQHAPLITRFTDISGAGHPEPRFGTQARMLWDDRYLYIAAELQEPDVWADLKLRDTIVYYNNDFEVFIDPDGDGHHYYEIEVNALCTVFDLFLEKPYRAPCRPHVQFQWNCPGLRIATHVDGSLNRPGDTDRGWSVEMAIPREAIAAEFDNCLQAGHYLRIGFSRVQWQHVTDKDGRYQRKQGADGNFLPEDNWTWGPTGEVAMHMPERWGYLCFLNEGEAPTLPGHHAERRLLWALYYAQEAHRARTGTFAASLAELGCTAADRATLTPDARLSLEATVSRFVLRVTLSDGRILSLDERGQWDEQVP